MLVCILGRQPELSVAELEAIYSRDAVKTISPSIATVDSPELKLEFLGGTIKYGEVIDRFPASSLQDKAAFLNISQKIIQHYTKKWGQVNHKITLGISAYNFKISPRDIQKTGLILKSSLKKAGVSLRLIPNDQPELSTAASHHNKLGLSDNKIELLIIKTRTELILAESRGAQNITAYAKRDRDRPKRDAFVGMLPPKLAQIMINLAGKPDPNRQTNLLDPFCGTGVILQEAALMGYTAYGSDLNPKMIDYTQKNLEWLTSTHKVDGKIGTLTAADATEHKWSFARQLDKIVCETYLGQPFSAPPSPEKLKQVVGNCNHIISQFLSNLHSQIKPTTRLCIAIPAWQGTDGRFTYLPLIKRLSDLGYRLGNSETLLYHRPDQVVARQLLVLEPLTD